MSCLRCERCVKFTYADAVQFPASVRPASTLKTKKTVKKWRNESVGGGVGKHLDELCPGRRLRWEGGQR